MRRLGRSSGFQVTTRRPVNCGHGLKVASEEETYERDRSVDVERDEEREQNRWESVTSDPVRGNTASEVNRQDGDE